MNLKMFFNKGKYYIGNQIIIYILKKKKKKYSRIALSSKLCKANKKK